MPGYRPPSTEPRGKWAKRIHEKRRAEGISQTGAFELLGPRLHFGPKSRYSYVALDMGTRQPTEAEAAVLAEWLGGYPEDTPEPLGSPQTPEAVASLIAAMTGALLAQMRALTDLRVELVEIRETMSNAREAALSERQAQAKILAELGEQLEALLSRGDTPTEAAGQGSGLR